MHQPESAAVGRSATVCVRLLTARAAQASHACRRARLLRLSLGIRSRGNAPRQPSQTLRASRATHGNAGARVEESHAPAGWYLHSLRLLQVPRVKASMRASTHIRILAFADGRTGPRVQAQPNARGYDSSKHWRLPPRRALGDGRAAQMPLRAQRSVRPSGLHCQPHDEDHLARCPARVNSILALSSAFHLHEIVVLSTDCDSMLLGAPAASTTS